MTIAYGEFLKTKEQKNQSFGVEIKDSDINPMLYDFQKAIVKWACRKGRGAVFADCGTGKSAIQLVWADHMVRQTNKPTLIITPLAVSSQTVQEGEKFGIECKRSINGKIESKITVTNYERLHYFNSNEFIAVVCDESGILKNFDGKRKAIITEFLRLRPYRLLCTATPSPNDYIELGTSSEALGYMGFTDMLNRFFKNDQSTGVMNRGYGINNNRPKWRFKKHAQERFWQWVASWALAMRKPSDLGFKDDLFTLPPLVERQVVIDNTRPLPGELFVRPAIGLKEQRKELRMTLTQRCEKVVDLVKNNGTALVWCHLNDEQKLLKQMLGDSAFSVHGGISDEQKEERLNGFINQERPILISKPKVAGFGLNLQHCNHVTFFPSHSFEMYYQSVRRCWRFGQKKPVTVDIVTTGGGLSVLANLQKKSKAADEMFSQLVLYMNDAIEIKKETAEKRMEVPEWL